MNDHGKNTLKMQMLSLVVAKSYTFVVKYILYTIGRVLIILAL
jgi:hypothetical protein